MSENIVVKSILGCIDELMHSYESRKDVISGFRTRARTAPQEAFSRGLAYALVYIASKSNVEVLMKGLTEDKCSDVIKQVMNIGVDEVPYGLYGAVLLHVLKKAGIIEAQITSETKEVFTEIITKIIDDPSIEAKSWLVLDWLKRITEAYIHD